MAVADVTLHQFRAVGWQTRSNAVPSCLPVTRPQSAADSNSASNRRTFRDFDEGLLAGFPVQDPRSEQISITGSDMRPAEGFASFWTLYESVWSVRKHDDRIIGIVPFS